MFHLSNKQKVELPIVTYSRKMHNQNQLRNTTRQSEGTRSDLSQTKYMIIWTKDGIAKLSCIQVTTLQGSKPVKPLI